MPFKPCAQKAAFTLVEVALALGIVSFAMVSIFGTLSVGLNTIHDAGVDMTSAQIIAQVSSTLQQTPFDQLETYAQNSLYFDLAGRQLTTVTNALYRVDLAVSLSGASTYPGAPNGLGTSAKSVQISVCPLMAAPQGKVSSKAVLLVPKS